MSTITAQEELASVRKSIQDALSSIHGNSARRSAKEQQLFSSVANSKCLKGIFSVHPPSNDEVVRALKSAGEEEQVEVECLRRYRGFLEARRKRFVALEAILGTILKEASITFATVDKVETLRGCPRTEVHEDEIDTELLHLFRLWRTVVSLQDLLLRPLIKGSVDGPQCELQNTSAEEESSYARDSALRATIADTQRMLFATRKRRVHLAAEAEALRTRAESTTHLLFRDEGTALIAGEKGEHVTLGASQGLQDIQRSTERLRRQKATVDEDAAALMERMANLRSQTAACKTSMELFSQSTRDVADETSNLISAKTNALMELHRKAQECASEQELLERNIGNYKQLCGLLEQLAANEKAKRDGITAATQAYHSLLAKEKAQEEKLISLRMSIKNLESDACDALREKQRAQGEVQYLLRLASDPTVAKRVLAGATEECTSERNVTSMGNYLRFVQKARLARHAS
ncbi:hypothetical protein LSCM1_06127 [Leishmania martiniquensis]|uniref:Uncharacterized protein n=1 Tax=Leishmania martiniquensis TaxID=1580590 RepID=A0A836HLA3_9TRYP|nr:hypothetical protein LSCM1_06127 [Leishmania martiniquensis]